jgi:hypothetical protein
MLTAILDKAELKRAHDEKEKYLTDGTDLVTLEKECRQLFEKYKGVSVDVARAQVIDHILSNSRIFYHPDELFVFGIENCNITGKIRYEMLWQNMKEKCPESASLQLLGYESGAYTGDCDFCHNCPDYEKLFAKGIGGIIAQAKKRTEKYPQNSREHQILLSVVISYTALQKLIDRYIA